MEKISKAFLMSEGKATYIDFTLYFKKICH